MNPGTQESAPDPLEESVDLMRLVRYVFGPPGFRGVGVISTGVAGWARPVGRGLSRFSCLVVLF